MSFSFRLKYILGVIPRAQKIESAWAELHKMRDDLLSIGKSAELARYHELKPMVQSSEFQQKKKEIINLAFKGSAEHKLLSEHSTLENSVSMKQYFKFTESPEFSRISEISKSPALAKYYELKKITESPEFILRKKEIESLRYKGSPEHIQRKKFDALQKNRRLNRYFTTIKSDKYRGFLELKASEKEKLKDRHVKNPEVLIYRKFIKSRDYKNLSAIELSGLPAEFEILTKVVDAPSFIQRESFLKNRNRYETTPDFPVYSEFNGLAQSSDIRFYLRSVTSRLFLNYQKIKASKELVRLGELRIKIKEKEFTDQVAFLKNKKRYLLTPEFKLESEFNDLEKSKLITTYHQLKKRPELAFFDQWTVELDENFTDNQLSGKLWQPENYWGAKILGASFSQSNELQAFNGLKNVEIKNSVLSIITRAEQTEGKVWDPSFGLIPRKFDYSSAIINTGNSYRFREGVVEAKVKFRANKGITSAFSLTGNKPFPQIDVFRSGHNRVGLGIISKSGKENLANLVQLKGLNFSKFHIFRVEIFGNQVVWKINNHEIHRDHLPADAGELFLNFTGSIHHAHNGQVLPHHFEIDWVRCLRKK